MDCHVSVCREHWSPCHYYDANPECKDIVQGPLMYDLPNVLDALADLGKHMYGRWGR